MYANRLRQLLDSLGPNEQIPSNELMALYTPPAGGFIRREDTGETLYTNGQPGGIYDQPTDFTTPQDPQQLDAMRQAAQQRFYQQQPQQQQRIKVVGYGNGITSDLGETTGPAPELDYSRPALQTMGGKAYYAKDGSGNAYMKNKDGSLTRVMLGYDRDASWQSTQRDMLRRKGEMDIANSQADLEHKAEVTAGLRAQNSIKEDPTSPAMLEKRYGKAEKGMQWTPDGRLVPIRGSNEDLQSQSTLDTGKETLRKIDEMIGQRDANGGLVEGSKTHPGFENVVGATMFPGKRLIPGTDAADFDARLNEVKGGAFLKAFETLKGGGQITEVEGKKATDAITRMGRSQSEAEFVKAAMEFRAIVQRGMDRLTQQRGGQPAAAAAPLDSGEQARAIFNAKKAIAQGADANLVKRRLESAGVTNHGL